MNKKAFLFLFYFLFSVVGSAQSLDERVKKIEADLEKLDFKVGLLEEKSQVIAGRTQIAYTNAWYFRTGLNLLFPRGSTFTYATDTGLGVFVGAGKYLERNFVFDSTFDWNLYPALSVRFRYEWKNEKQTLNMGPILGMKLRLSKQRPLDNFIDSREELRGILLQGGLGAGFPLGLSVVQTEILAEFNRQFFVVASLGLHFFL